MGKDWGQYLKPKEKYLSPKQRANQYVSTCVKCRTLPVYVDGYNTSYSYRWCKTCMEREDKGPFKTRNIKDPHHHPGKVTDEGV